MQDMINLFGRLIFDKRNGYWKIGEDPMSAKVLMRTTAEQITWLRCKSYSLSSGFKEEKVFHMVVFDYFLCSFYLFLILSSSNSGEKGGL